MQLCGKGLQVTAQLSLRHRAADLSCKCSSCISVCPPESLFIFVDYSFLCSSPFHGQLFFQTTIPPDLHQLQHWSPSNAGVAVLHRQLHQLLHYPSFCSCSKSFSISLILIMLLWLNPDWHVPFPHCLWFGGYDWYHWKLRALCKIFPFTQFWAFWLSYPLSFPPHHLRISLWEELSNKE